MGYFKLYIKKEDGHYKRPKIFKTARGISKYISKLDKDYIAIFIDREGKERVVFDITQNQQQKKNEKEER